MTAPSIPSVESPWEAEGRRVAGEFDGVSSAVLIATDPSAAAAVALGIGRVHARRRRVAIADCVGEIPQLQQLLPRDAAHGIVDSFSYGVSLSKIAYPIDPAQNLLIMPSGPGPLDHATMLESDRWAKLAAGFREIEGLLLILAPANAPGLEALVASTDGSVVVGDRFGVVPGPVLLDVRLPLAAVEPTATAAAARKVDSGPRSAITTGDQSAFNEEVRRRVALFGGGAIAALAVAGALVWWFNKPDSAPVVRAPTVAAAPAAAPAPAPRTDSLVSNAADSSRAAAYAVDIAQVPAYNQALKQLEGDDGQQQQPLTRPLPAATIGSVGGGADAGFHVMAGAFVNRASADSLLARMRDDRRIPGGSGRVVRAPFALLVDERIAPARIPAMLTAYRNQGMPVYAMLQDDNTATLYAGAFERPEQAATLRDIFTQSNKDVSVVYRTGRAF